MSNQSPSITQFFKAQRKRPRGLKEDGDLMLNKRIVLEGGVLETGVKEEVIVKPKVVVTEKPVKTEERKKKKAVGPKKSKKKDGEGSIFTFVKPVLATATVTADGLEKVVEKDKESENVASAPESVPPVEKEKLVEESAVPSASAAEASGEVGEAVAGPSSEKDSVAPESPIKFMKVGRLSPQKKKMTPEEMARILKKKKKLGELKKTLEGMNQCAQKLTEFRKTVAEANARMMSPVKDKSDLSKLPCSPLASKFSASKVAGISPAQFYSPTADRVRADLDRLSASKVVSPSKVVSGSSKVKKRLFEEQPSPSDRDKSPTVPAYQRFHTLAQKTPAEKGSKDEEIDLPLPFRFKILKELFNAVDTVLGIMKSRKENIIFPKVKIAVQELFRKVALREGHLAQMVTILPGCYSFSLEKVGRETHIKIDVEDLLPSVVCARRKAFNAGLVKICLEEHQKFLLSLAPPIIVPADKQITRWHPSFKIDEIADVIPKENALPKKPEPEKISTAREVIAKAQNILEFANPRMKNAVKNMLNKEGDDGSKNATPVIAQPNPVVSAKMKALKGVSSSLLEKIRNREREKLMNEMTRSPAESKKLQMTRQLPNFIKIIRNMMVADKKVALPIDVVVNRISHSIQNMSCVDTESHVRLLVTLLPSWIKIHKLSHSSTEYVRIEKATDINILLEEMSGIIKKLSS